MKPYYEDEWVTLYHGDCREVLAWLDADVLVTDPPYGIAWSAEGQVGRRFKGVERTSVRPPIANDETTAARDEVISLWGGARPMLVFGSPRLAPPEGTKHVLTWRKPNDAGLVGSWLPWRRDTESVYVLGAWPKSEGLASSVLEGPRGMHSYLSGHPHSKPLSLLEDLILKCPPGVVADPFSGGGSTLVAAKALGRRAIGVEVDERYCEIAARRLAQDTLFGSAS